MKLLVVICVVIFCSSLSYGQEDMPVFGSLDQLSGKTKLYLIATTTKSRERIQKIIEKDKTFQIVPDARQADFILEFNPIAKTRYPIQDSAEMTAFFYSEKQKIIAWSKTFDRFKKVIGKLEENEDALTKQFLKAVKDTHNTNKN